MLIVNFNLIPWDPEAYLVAADYAEENGFLLPNAIRNKVLPLDIEKGNGSGEGITIYMKNNYTEIYTGFSENYAVHFYGSGNGYGLGLGYGNGCANPIQGTDCIIADFLGDSRGR